MLTIYHKTEYRERRNHYAIYSVNAPVTGFYDREQLRPPGLVPASRRSWWMVIPRSGGERLVATSVCTYWRSSPLPGYKRPAFLGYVENPVKGVAGSSTRAAKPASARFQTTGQVDAALDALRGYWTEMLSTYTVKSGDECLDRMVNIWNPYQCMVTFNMSRSASYFETGIGRGMGFRDSNHAAGLRRIPTRARAERILDRSPPPEAGPQARTTNSSR